MKIKKALGLGSAFLSFSMTQSTTALAEYYAGADAVYMDGRSIFYNGRTPFDLTTARVRFGQRLDEMGWEIQALAPASGTGNFSSFTAEHEYEIRYGLGILWTAASRDRRWHGGIGFTQMSTEYNLITGPSFGTKFKDDTQYFTLNFGGQYPISSNGALTLDYTWYQGRVNCTICVDPVTGDPSSNTEIQIHAISVGLNYSF